MTRTSTRLWVAGAVVVALLLVTASWFLLLAPQRAEAADLRAQTADTVAQNDSLEVQIAQLEAQFAELPQRQAELAEIRQAMPEQAALPTLVRDLDALAAAAGVTLMSVAPGEPTAVAAPADPAAVPADPAAAPAAPAAPADPAAAPADPAATPATPLYQVPTSVVVVGDFFSAELFLKKVQTELKRALLVEGLTVQAEQAAEASGGKPSTENGDVTMTITGSVFVLPTDATAATPAPAATTAPVTP